jgi:CRISPR-associated protein Cmr1
MKQIKLEVDLLTPCFCAGGEPLEAEIRPPSIRGQLRWWFRTLGGFRSLQGMPLREQETLVFGSAGSNEQGNASRLVIRTVHTVLTGQPTTKTYEKNSPEVGIQHPSGYVLFPLRNKTRQAIEKGSFTLTALWKGEDRIWPDLCSLLTVFLNLGALGFRSRRGFGALAPKQPKDEALFKALDAFANARSALGIFQLEQLYPEGIKAAHALASWLKGWRTHGRSSDLVNGRPRVPQAAPGFQFAKNDHDVGYQMSNARGAALFRPALGLPIIQRCGRSITWDLKGQGRFASPVLLRPHKAQDGKVQAWIIFVEAHKWRPEFVASSRELGDKKVSLELFEVMQEDERLLPVYPLS